MPPSIGSGSRAWWVSTNTSVWYGGSGPHQPCQESAGDRDILISGGGSTARQFISMGVVEQIGVHVAPVLLGRGERLFPDDGPDYELAEVVCSPRVSHYTFTRT